MIDQQKQLIPFHGYPIFKIKTGELLNEDELNFFKSLTTTSHFFQDLTKTKLTRDDNILNNIELKRIKDIIWKHFVDYVDNVLEINNKFYMCNSWGTIQKKDDYHPNHTHKNAIFSSVFYIHAENSSLTFSFDKSRIEEGFFFAYHIKNYNHFNSSSWEVPVETGDLIIFPGELEHVSKIHTGNYDRLIIGSSYFLKGDLGSDSNYNSISI